MKFQTSNLLLFFSTASALAIGTALGAFIFRPSDENKSVYAIWDGQKIFAAEVLPLIQGDLDQLEKNRYQLKKRTTEDLIRKKTLEKKQVQSADKKTATPEALPLAVEISEQEFIAFLKLRSMDPKKITALDRANILGNMKLQKTQEAEKKQAEIAMKEAQIQWKIPLPPEVLVSVPKASMPSLGSLSAPVKLMIISNFHCPNCTEAEQRLSELKEKYKVQLKDKVQISYQFTMQEPDSSMVRAAAEASYCAEDQGQFWAYHDKLATAPKVLDLEALSKVAETLHLNMETFKSCLSSRKYKLVLMKEMENLAKTTSSIAPSFVINGRIRSGVSTIEELSILIDQELKN